MLRSILTVTALALPTLSIADTAGQFGGGKLTTNSEFLATGYDQDTSVSTKVFPYLMGPVSANATNTSWAVEPINDLARQSTEGVLSVHGEIAYTNQLPLTPYFSQKSIFN